MIRLNLNKRINSEMLFFFKIESIIYFQFNDTLFFILKQLSSEYRFFLAEIDETSDEMVHRYLYSQEQMEKS